MVNTKMFEFKHPKYYKELRKRNNGHGRANLNGPRVAGARSLPASDQVISKESSTEENQRAPGPGPKRQASGGKPQAPSLEKQASSPEEQASSRKP
jgi:hypothetical protein